MWLILAGGALLVALAIWEFWICEGAHLGPHFVVWLYDLAAGRYDKIKHFDPDWERRFLGEPIANALGGLDGACLLDVGAGTGRVARALRGLPFFRGTVIGLEPSARMLSHARRLAADTCVHWVRGRAAELPFPDGAGDMVVCLEVLEFTPRPKASLAELVRVLRPGAWLLVTNRIGWQAPLILGRTFRRTEIAPVLTSLGLLDIESVCWQVDYDLVWARKGQST
jgi:ubiquinone/menaquinone biosynthesis C-methylase UbiE